jgi:hypothetical protein
MEDRGDNTIAYAANAVNEYTTIGGVGVAYDACGNLSKDAAGYSYAYDHDNRLVCVYTDANADGDYDAGTDTGHGLYAYVGAMFANRAEIRPWPLAPLFLHNRYMNCVELAAAKPVPPDYPW